jgi:hypothetical protein
VVLFGGCGWVGFGGVFKGFVWAWGCGSLFLVFCWCYFLWGGWWGLGVVGSVVLFGFGVVVVSVWSFIVGVIWSSFELECLIFWSFVLFDG